VQPHANDSAAGYSNVNDANDVGDDDVNDDDVIVVDDNDGNDNNASDDDANVNVANDKDGNDNDAMDNDVNDVNDNDVNDNDASCHANQNRSISFALFNVDGLWRILNELDILSLIHKFDFVLFVETFTDSIPDSLFTSHIVFACPGVKVSDSVHGRLSGGVALLVRKALAPYVQRIHVELDNIIVVKLSSTLTGTTFDIFFIGAYIPPENSVYYEETDIYNGISMLEDCLLDLYKDYGDVPVVICGDLNARTGLLNFSNVDPIGDLYNVVDASDDDDVSQDYMCRVSKDTTVNSFGRFLLSMCNEFGLVILNGLKTLLNTTDDFTFISTNGCSVIDYFLVSTSLLPHCENLVIKQMIESKHALVEFCLSVSTDVNITSPTSAHRPTSTVTKYKWNDDRKELFFNNMCAESVKETLQEADSLVNCDANLALRKFNECFIFAGDCMKKTIVIGSERRQVWFDLECRESRKILRTHLHRFSRTNLDTDRHAYAHKRKEYKELLRQKKKAHKDKIIQSLQVNFDKPKQFWETVRSVRPRSGGASTISSEEWFNHFQRVFNDFSADAVNDFDFDTHYSNTNRTYENSGLLDVPISVTEVEAALRALKSDKAAGPDGLIGEFYKHSVVNTIPFLVKFFNHIFDHGIFPDDWSSSVLQPLHKKGDINVTDNYRGISLLNVCSKLYSFVLNKRLTVFMEENDIVGEEQAGFRAGRCTTDHIFTLLSCIQKQLLRHRKLYVAFIDFRKAFDSVRRDKLWRILNANGINGKFLNALKSMYIVVKARVRAGGELTDAFMCPRGLKQGENNSPNLFALFINELTREINQFGKHGIQLSPEFIQILILLFADDVALLSDSIIGLQTQLNILYDIAKRLDLIVNLDKSNIVVFRNGGFLSQNERWLFGDARLEVVSMYKYLGVTLTTRLSFQPTMRDLAERGRKGCAAIIKMLWSIGEFSPNIFFKLFDTQIQPILTYGAEIWGLTSNQECIERVHLSAMKRLLGVSQRAPRHLIYGELGRHPLYINTFSKCVKFWLRLVCMDNSRYPKKAYNMLLMLQRQNYTTWVCSVRNVLYKFGFGIVWEAQCVGSVKLFIVEFKQRLLDCFTQDWHSALSSHTYFDSYSSYSQSLYMKPYLDFIKFINMRRVLSRFRIGMSNLRSRFLQYEDKRNLNRNVNCPFCTDSPETEFHFLFVCPTYDQLRMRYIPEKFRRHPSLFRMSLLLACENERVVFLVCNFVFKAFLLRTKEMELLRVHE